MNEVAALFHRLRGGWNFPVPRLSVVVSVMVASWFAASCHGDSAAGTEHIQRAPRISPDYRSIILPPNIAPLNFVIAEDDVVQHRVRLASTQGTPIEVKANGARVVIPIGPWRSLLQANRGRSLSVEVSMLDKRGSWHTYDPITNEISSDPIDSHLVYRLLRPVYNVYGPVGIYQRDLESYRQDPLLENKDLDRGCVNCHTFLEHKPEQMALHIRNKDAGNPMLLIRSNQVTRISKTSGYISWHPSGRLLAFSVNKFTLLFHTSGETRDLYDGASDLGIYRVDSNVVVNPPAISQPERLETWPSWSPDGRFLYFCSAPKLKIERLKQIRYDLMRVPYDLDHDRWGEPEVLISARDTRLSAAQPRVSPDGRWLLFCLAPNGNFPAYQAGSDLYIMDLVTRQTRRADEINSDRSDSWHCWSSNGRWLVFSSKRRDGLFTRPYFAHVTDDGHFSQPFILPQRDPEFYDSFDRTFNLPELIQTPVSVKTSELIRGVFKPRHVLTPTTLATDLPVAEHEAEEGRSAEGSRPP